MLDKWGKAQTNYILHNWKRLTDKEIACELTRITGIEYSYMSVYKKREKLGLQKYTYNDKK